MPHSALSSTSCSSRPVNPRRLSLHTVFAGLAKELDLLAPHYARTCPPELASYPTLPGLLDRLTRGGTGADASHGQLVCTVIARHRAAPHRLWVAVLLQTFRPMLRRTFKRLIGADREERLALLLTSFQEAIRRVDPHRDPVRIGMYVRQATRRSLFVALGRERDWEAVGFGVDADETTDMEGQARALAVEWLKDTPDGELLCTSAEHGGLWALVRRTHPALPAPEQRRVYHRLRHRRQELLAELRERLGHGPSRRRTVHA